MYMKNYKSILPKAADKFRHEREIKMPAYIAHVGKA